MLDTLNEVLAAGAVTPYVQPIIDLASGTVVAHEALSRGPAGGPLHEAGALFGAAARGGRLPELDVLCRTRAMEAALAAGMTAPGRLFLNIEPVTVAAGHAAIEGFLAWRDRGLRLVLEITERALTGDPAALLAYSEAAHAAGLAVAVDDVGAVPESLALLPFLRPEVIKLDLRLVQTRPDADVASIMTAVTAHAERSGALVLAEGVETAQHEQMARSLGATLAQGYRYGRPAPVPGGPGEVRAASDPRPRPRPRPAPRRTADVPPPGVPGALALPDVVTAGVVVPDVPSDSPFDWVSSQRPSQAAPKDLLVAVSRLLERQAATMGGLAVVLATFEVASYLTPASVRRYDELGRKAAFVVVLGSGMPLEPVPGVRGGDLVAGDPVRDEWDVVVVGPHFAGALVARDRFTGGPEPERMFDYVLTYDRPLVLDVAAALMRRALPVPDLYTPAPADGSDARPGPAAGPGTAPTPVLPRAGAPVG